MDSEDMFRVTLSEYETEDGEFHRLVAYIDADGTLVLEGYDLGKSVREVWGVSDYEYWRRVRREHVNRVLLELIRDRFSSDVKFHKWLESKGIPDEFFSY